MIENTQVSLIISTYNWPEALELCLKSIQLQKVLPAEVIIADDGSGESTRRLIEQYQQKFPVALRHVWHEDQGFRKTIILNKAIQTARGNYIVQIDGDVLLEPHFIGDHCDSAEPSTFVRGTRALLSPEKTSLVLRSKSPNVSLWSSGIHNRNNALRIAWLKGMGSRKEMSSRSVRGSNLAFWKADFIKVNGYNNELLGWGHEDEELAARFINNGIIKKIVKLCAIQYHLYHAEQSRENEPWQNNMVQRTVKEKIMRCKNGYRLLNNND